MDTVFFRDDKYTELYEETVKRLFFEWAASYRDYAETQDQPVSVADWLAMPSFNGTNGDSIYQQCREIACGAVEMTADEDAYYDEIDDIAVTMAGEVETGLTLDDMCPPQVEIEPIAAFLP